MKTLKILSLVTAFTLALPAFSMNEVLSSVSSAFSRPAVQCGLAAAAAVGAYFLYTKQTTTEPIQKVEQCDARTCVIIFDIDDVLLENNRLAIMQAVYKHFGAVLKGVTDISLMRKLKGACSEEWKLELAQNDHKEFAQCIEEIGHSKDKIKGMQEIVEQLKAQGFELHIASNMGRDDYRHYSTKFPELFGNFDERHVYVVDYERGRERIKKPDARYFKNYEAACPTDKTQRLFIDDKLKNGRASGYMFIQCKNKNAQQVRADLARHGIYVK